jgi:hypothetical protein
VVLCDDQGMNDFAFIVLSIAFFAVAAAFAGFCRKVR